MRKRTTPGWSLALMGCAVALLWPDAGSAQTLSGSARAVRATIASPQGITTTQLADTGTLGGATDAREASATDGSIPSLLSGQTLHATTIGWSDQVSSEASIAALAITVGGNTITADFVQARAISAGRRTSAAANIDGLVVNGSVINVSGDPNQTITIPGGTIVINERVGSVVNALHIIINGEADVIVASVDASAQ
jgi:hypothetical protein